jgi:hypothetical protein
VKRLKFSNKFVVRWLRRVGLTGLRCTAVDKPRPGVDVIRARMAEIAHVIKFGYPPLVGGQIHLACNKPFAPGRVCNADETAICHSVPPARQYVPAGTVPMLCVCMVCVCVCVGGGGG